MNPEEEALNFHLAVLKEYENIPTFATMGMNPWEDEELAAVRRLIRSERRAQRFIDTVPVLNSYIAEVVAKWPPERITLMMLARIAHYYATCTIFCAVWRARNALEAYLHDQKHLTSPLDVTADEILSADESERSILCSLKSLYNVLYQCPRDEFTNDFREQVAEHIESYLDIALAVADDPQVRRLRDYLRDFFAYDYQPVATRPLTQAEIDALPELNFEALATLWKDAACSYAIAFANRNQDKEPVKAIVVGVDEQVKTSFWNAFLSELKTFTKTIVRKRNNYGKRPDISLENAAKLTGLTVDQLRTVEKLNADQQMGYPGRTGDNLAFAEKSLIMWAQTYRSAKRAEKTAQKGLAKPIHSPTL